MNRGESPTAAIISNCSTPASRACCARLDIDLVQRFDMFGDKRNRNHQKVFGPCAQSVARSSARATAPAISAAPRGSGSRACAHSATHPAPSPRAPSRRPAAGKDRPCAIRLSGSPCALKTRCTLPGSSKCVKAVLIRSVSASMYKRMQVKILTASVRAFHGSLAAPARAQNAPKNALRCE